MLLLLLRMATQPRCCCRRCCCRTVGVLGVAGRAWVAAADAGRAAGLLPRFVELLKGRNEGLAGVLGLCCSVLGGWGRHRLDNILLLLLVPC